MTRLLTIPEVMRALHMSKRSVYREMEAGRLRYAVIGGKRQVTEAEVEAFIAAAFRAA